MPKKTTPSSNRISEMARALGQGAWTEYVNLRERYKSEGLTPKEAYQRASAELRIVERYEDWRRRRTMQEMLDRSLPMTPQEVKQIIPSYQPATAVKAESVGNEEMTLPEQVAWAKKWAARVQNGELAPTKFPNEGALFWFQSAIANRREFEKIVLRVESPTGDGENQFLQDGQYQLKELERQIEQAVKETGKKLAEMESGFAELLKELAGAPVAET